MPTTNNPATAPSTHFRPHSLQQSFKEQLASSPVVNMSIARAFTKRLHRSDSKRPHISAPLELISTTNALSYNAPDVATFRNASSMTDKTTLTTVISERSSAEHTDSSRPAVEEPGLTDASSIETSPVASPLASPIEQNHLTCYFPPANDSSKLRRSLSARSVTPALDAPAIPRRALSHSKREHERLARKRSVRSSSGTSSQSDPRLSKDSPVSETRTSFEIIGVNTPIAKDEVSVLDSPTSKTSPHPFSLELEKLNEVAEEFGGVSRDAEASADIVVMQTKGYAKLSAADYIVLIAPLHSLCYSETSDAAANPPPAVGWL